VSGLVVAAEALFVVVGLLAEVAGVDGWVEVEVGVGF